MKKPRKKIRVTVKKPLRIPESLKGKIVYETHSERVAREADRQRLRESILGTKNV